MWPGFISVALLICLMLIFPNGQLPSPRWRWLPCVVLIDTVLSVIFAAFARGPVDSSLGVPMVNPFGLPGPLGDAFQWIINVSPFLLIEMLLIVLGCVSLVARYRIARGEVRVQLRWLAASIVLVAVLLVGQVVALVLYPNAASMPVWAQLLVSLSQLSFIFIPISAGIAILRYHLYDIDRIINRTLVYAALTAVLALIYFGGVIVLQFLLRAATGEQQSTIATVLSTLAIAALFAPLRGRIQQVIDRNFYRRKYDSERILAAFRGTVRSEVDLDQLGQQLLNVVSRTFEPVETELWLRRKGRM
jgi:hypothetical protein